MQVRVESPRAPPAASAVLWRLAGLLVHKPLGFAFSFLPPLKSPPTGCVPDLEAYRFTLHLQSGAIALKHCGTVALKKKGDS